MCVPIGSADSQSSDDSPLSKAHEALTSPVDR